MNGKKNIRTKRTNKIFWKRKKKEGISTKKTKTKTDKKEIEQNTDKCVAS